MKRLENQLFTEDEFQAAKSREKVLGVECKSCKKPFLTSRHKVLQTKSTSATLGFCSQLCVGRSHAKPLTVICPTCESTITKAPNQLRQSRSGRSFCSQSCAATFNNKNKKHGTRRSKLEVWLEKQLTTKYPNLEVHYNRKDAVGSELDIYFPSLKIAVELNGIFHYEPIYGDSKLNQVQDNDSRKFLACQQAGVSLCIIDVSKFTYFKEVRALEYLEIIEKVVSGCSELN